MHIRGGVGLVAVCLFTSSLGAQEGGLKSATNGPFLIRTIGEPAFFGKPGARSVDPLRVRVVGASDGKPPHNADGVSVALRVTFSVRGGPQLAFLDDRSRLLQGDTPVRTLVVKTDADGEARAFVRFGNGAKPTEVVAEADPSGVGTVFTGYTPGLPYRLKRDGWSGQALVFAVSDYRGDAVRGLTDFTLSPVFRCGNLGPEDLERVSIGRETSPGRYAFNLEPLKLGDAGSGSRVVHADAGIQGIAGKVVALDVP